MIQPEREQLSSLTGVAILGPAVLISDARLMPSHVAFILQIVYQPLEELSRKSAMAESILDSDLRLWGRKN